MEAAIRLDLSGSQPRPESFKGRRIQMHSDSEYLNHLMLLLLSANGELNGAQARSFAEAIIKAERLEKYIWMNQIIQEALYGAPKHESAA